MTMALAGVLVQAFLLILIVIAIYMVVTRIKTWIEKYLDMMLMKLDMLAAQNAEREQTATALVAMSGKVEGMEKKLDNIERILEKVAE